MIDPKAKKVYAQFHEDAILAVLFDDVKKGFYVDIGANYPKIDSVTKYFYDKGWRGINIEPLKDLHRQLVEQRPRDINLNFGVGEKNEKLTLYEDSRQHGHSSFIKTNVPTSKIKEVEVEVRTLEDILDEYADARKIHFMKIDVEGFEHQVIKGNNWKKYRPEVICVESNHKTKKWESILRSNEYRLFITDGLNDYYIANESWARTEGYAEKAVTFDSHALRLHHYRSWREDSRLLVELTNLNEEKERMIQHLQQQNRLSLSDQSYPKRLFRALKGLTVDWVRYKLNK